jgi:hypothetical protein
MLRNIICSQIFNYIPDRAVQQHLDIWWYGASESKVTLFIESDKMESSPRQV